MPPSKMERPVARRTFAELARRCVEMAVQQGLTEQDLRNAADDITDCVRARLKGVNRTEADRLK